MFDLASREDPGGRNYGQNLFYDAVGLDLGWVASDLFR